MRGAKLIVVPLVLLMLAWFACVAWSSLQAAGASTLTSTNTQRRAGRLERAIRETEQEMVGDYR